MSSTRKHAEIVPRLRLSSLKVPVSRVLRKISVIYNKKIHKSSTTLRRKLTKDDVALASAWPLPFEITNYEVAIYLSRWDIVNLGLTVSSSAPACRSVDISNYFFQNKAMLSSVLSTLYSSVDLRSNTRCRDCLQFLISRPDIAGCVKSLTIAPNYLENHDKRLLKEELVIARNLKRVIPNLHSLREFRWDGLEIPEDSIWLSLRTQ